MQERMGHDDDLHIVLARETDEGRLASCHPSFRVLPKTTAFCPIKRKRTTIQQTAVVTCTVSNYFPPTLIDALH